MMIAILAACALLLVGAALRSHGPGMARIAMPASVIGGAIGLVALELLARSLGDVGTGESPGAVDLGRSASENGPSATTFVQSLAQWAVECQRTFRTWPGFLIAVIFAGMLLERRPRRARSVTRGVMQEGAMVWIIVLGQVLIGLVATWLIIAPMTGVPIFFGQLIEAGFAGGHGTAAALGSVYDEVNRFPGGRDLAMFMATVGLVYGVVSGVVFVNVAIRRGWTARRRLGDGVASAAPPPGMLTARVRRLPSEAIDPLALQCALLGVAVGIGWLFQQGVAIAMREGFGGPEGAAPAVASAVDKIPLFMFALLGGLTLRWLLQMVGASHLVDGAAIRRLMGVAMEFLIVAALASLRLDVVVEHAWGLALLLALAFAWTGVCLLVLSKLLLPRDYWFELGIINYGMSTGTTAQGVMLLRMVDPELESEAAEDYALAAPLSAPFVGGGTITIAMPFILERAGAGIVIAAVAAGLAVAALIAWRLMDRRTHTQPQ